MKKININIIMLRRWRRVISKMGQIKKKNELKVVIYGEQDWEREWVRQKIVVFCYKPFTVFDFLKTMHPVNSLEKTIKQRVRIGSGLGQILNSSAQKLLCPIRKVQILVVL